VAVNLFARLHKWASRQDENFLTEALAVVLQTLLEREPACGMRLIGALTGGFIGPEAKDPSRVEIGTQIETAEGRPDLEISTPERLAVAEVKVEAGLRRGQLEGYREYLRASQLAETRLVLLTKYPPNLKAGDESPDLVVRWYEVADWIEQEVAGQSIQEPVSVYLCEQFHSFLRERNMAITHVGWQLKEGGRALQNFMVMLQETARACQIPEKSYMSVDQVGYTLQGGRYWFGIMLAEPEKLWFATRGRIDPDAARRLGIGSVEPDEPGNRVPGGMRWWRAGELESEEVHFYLLSKVKQIQWLEKFLRECLELARQIEIPDSTPDPPEPPEE
jgi:hypothetical protein